MSQRIFTDSAGVRWTVWDVHPQDTALVTSRERRAERERRGAPAPEPVIERRGSTERRVEGRSLPRIVLPGYEHGWLVFRDASRHVVRRLAPAPSDWATCDRPTLDAYCQRATPAREILGGRGMPIQDALDAGASRADTRTPATRGSLAPHGRAAPDRRRGEDRRRKR